MKFFRTEGGTCFSKELELFVSGIGIKPCRGEPNGAAGCDF
jgi:hypothetical protein